MRFTRSATVLGAAGLLLTGSAIGYAAIPGPGDAISACFATQDAPKAVLTILVGGQPPAYSKGDVRLVESDEPCRSYETPINWNQKGVKGDKGDPGTPSDGSVPGTGHAWTFSYVRDAGHRGSVTLRSSQRIPANMRVTSVRVSDFSISDMGNCLSAEVALQFGDIGFVAHGTYRSDHSIDFVYSANSKWSSAPQQMMFYVNCEGPEEQVDDGFHPPVSPGFSGRVVFDTAPAPTIGLTPLPFE